MWNTSFGNPTTLRITITGNYNALSLIFTIPEHERMKTAQLKNAMIHNLPPLDYITIF